VLAPGQDAILVHRPPHPVLAHREQHCQIAVAKAIIRLVPRFDSNRHLLIFDRLFGAPIERRTAYAQSAGHLAFRTWAIGDAQLESPFHQLARPYFPPTAERLFLVSRSAPSVRQ
jgi:hypothetical protein